MSRAEIETTGLSPDTGYNIGTNIGYSDIEACNTRYGCQYRTQYRVTPDIGVNIETNIRYSDTGACVGPSTPDIGVDLLDQTVTAAAGIP